MTRPTRHPKTGVYQFRRAIPAELRAVLGKAEVKKSLGTKDPEEAKRRFVEVLADMDRQWDGLRGGSRPLTEARAHELALPIYENWLAMHRDEPSQQLSWPREFYGSLWTEALPSDVESAHPESISISTLLIRNMRSMCLRHADTIIADHGLILDHYDRFKMARAVGAAFQRASIEIAVQSEGGYIGTPGNPHYQQPLQGRSRVPSQSLQRPQGGHAKPIPVMTLLEDWWREAKAAGRKPSTYESYRNTFREFAAFLTLDDVRSVSAEDVVAFKDHRLRTPSRKTGRIPSAKTVKDSDLSALKTVFGWAVVNRQLADNPAKGITIKLSKPPRLRSKGFSDAEAKAILSLALNYIPKNESPPTAAAKRWVPWLCAFTGARVGEIGQLRKQDVTKQGDDWIIRITPEAGTTKTNEAREVVLHPQIVEQGFPEFVKGSEEGPLFLRPAKNGDVLGPLQGLKNRLAEFARTVVPDPNVAPNHGWRHRFKTVGMEAGIAPRILDAIQGQAPRSVAETYGDVTIVTISSAIACLPCIDPTNGEQ